MGEQLWVLNKGLKQQCRDRKMTNNSTRALSKLLLRIITISAILM